MISKGHFKEAEKVLRRIAVENKRNFDPVAFEQLKEEQEKVSDERVSSLVRLVSLPRLEHGEYSESRGFDESLSLSHHADHQHESFLSMVTTDAKR